MYLFIMTLIFITRDSEVIMFSPCVFVCVCVCVCVVVYVCHDVCPDDLAMKDWCHTNNILQVHCWGCLVVQVMFRALMTSLMTSQDHKDNIIFINTCILDSNYNRVVEIISFKKANSLGYKLWHNRYGIVSITRHQWLGKTTKRVLIKSWRPIKVPQNAFIILIIYEKNQTMIDATCISSMQRSNVYI